MADLLAFVSFLLHLIRSNRDDPHLSFLRSATVSDRLVRSVLNERENVKKLIALTVASITLAGAAMTAMADNGGTAAEARAMALLQAAKAVPEFRLTGEPQVRSASPSSPRRKSTVTRAS